MDSGSCSTELVLAWGEEPVSCMQSPPQVEGDGSLSELAPVANENSLGRETAVNF